MKLRPGLAFLLCAGVITMAGCTTYRAATATTVEKVGSLDGCSSPKTFRKMVGGPDDVLDVPGGGRIDIHKYHITAGGKAGKIATSSFLNLATLGAWEFVAGSTDVASAAAGACHSGGIGGQCDYAKERVIIHYGPGGKIACVEREVLREGALLIMSDRDGSECPQVYRAALAREMDVSALPQMSIQSSSEANSRFGEMSAAELGSRLESEREVRCQQQRN